MGLFNFYVRSSTLRGAETVSSACERRLKFILFLFARLPIIYACLSVRLCLLVSVHTPFSSFCLDMAVACRLCFRLSGKTFLPSHPTPEMCRNFIFNLFLNDVYIPRQETTATRRQNRACILAQRHLHDYTHTPHTHTHTHTRTHVGTRTYTLCKIVNIFL